MNKTIGFSIRELADAYAFKTLSHYLKVLPFHQRFIDNADMYESPIVRRILEKEEFAKENDSIDLLVRSETDISQDDTPENTLDIDISILKNCSMPFTDKEKLAMKKKYEIHNVKPVLVIGFAYRNSNITRLIEKFHQDLDIYLVGEHLSLEDLGFSDVMMKNIHTVTKRGLLRDYYAMADIAVNRNNLAPLTDFHRTVMDRTLNNFIEATEGGPLFMVPPNDKVEQYGYSQLVRLGAIKEFTNEGQLIEGIMDYIGMDENQKNIIKCQRKDHLIATRAKYLPFIAEVISRKLDGEAIFDLKNEHIILANENSYTKMTHPDTDWKEIPYIPPNPAILFLKSTIGMFRGLWQLYTLKNLNHQPYK